MLGFCGGSGVTPVISVTKHVLATTGRPVRLLYANRDRASVIFEDALAGLADRHAGRLAVRHHIDADAGFVTGDDVAAFVGEAAGPTPTATSADPARSWTWSRRPSMASGWDRNASSSSVSWSSSRKRRPPRPRPAARSRQRRRRRRPK